MINKISLSYGKHGTWEVTDIQETQLGANTHAVLLPIETVLER